MLPRIVTIESSLRSFQYKILNNILYLNERLFKFNIVDSPLCSLCQGRIGTYIFVVPALSEPLF